MAVTEKQKKNLRSPITKGEVRNPRGINQYTGSRGELYKAIQESLTRFGPDAVRRAYKLAAKGGKKDEGATERLALATLLVDDIVDKVYEWETKGQTRDVDFIRYRIFKSCFDEQQKVLMSWKKILAIICGRRSGKSWGFAKLAVDRSMAHEKGFCRYIGLTVERAFEIIWHPLIETVELAGIAYKTTLRPPRIELSNGTTIAIGGRHSKNDIENYRGDPVFLAIIDETQADEPDKLRMLVRDVLEPAGKDFTDAQIALGGTPSRIPGNYAEELYQSAEPGIGRFNWNLSVNPFIPEQERDLEATRVAKSFSSTDPTFLREYMGRVGAYDVEALVYRLSAGNRFVEADLPNWISSQPITDIFFCGGIDYGFDDFNSCNIVMASESRGERFLLAEYKGHRISTSQFGNEIKRLMATVLENPILARIPNKRLTFFCDTEGLGKQLTHDLAADYGISVQPAYQGQQDLMVEQLQDDIIHGRLKVRAPQVIDGKEVIGPFEEESRKIVFARDPVTDQLTRRIDEDIFHPEAARSLQYNMRTVWLKSRVKPGSGRIA